MNTAEIRSYTKMAPAAVMISKISRGISIVIYLSRQWVEDLIGRPPLMLHVK
jgi:hypothetical protein